MLVLCCNGMYQSQSKNEVVGSSGSEWPIKSVVT